jgi:hypothetical protein
MTTGIIKKGTKLFNGSTVKEKFNPILVNLNESNDTLSAFFSTNEKMALTRIGECSNDKHGYIHTFEVREDIDNIFLLPPQEDNNKKDWLNTIIDKKYCTGYENNVYNGAGFFILRNKNIVSAEYALCNPQKLLKYIGTKNCNSK